MTKKDITVTKYISNDNIEFNNEESCIVHENHNAFIKQHGSVWIVYQTIAGYRNDIECFSSKELAELSLKYIRDDDSYTVDKININDRFSSLANYPEAEKLLKENQCY